MLRASESLKMRKSTENTISKRLWPSQKWKQVSADNLGQNIADKFTKLSNISFFLECFTAFPVFLQTVKLSFFWWPTGYSLSIPGILGIPKIRLNSLSCSAAFAFTFW